MDVSVVNVAKLDPDFPNLRATVIFSDDDRDKWIRSCEVEVYLSKDEVGNLTISGIREIAIEKSYTYLEQILADRTS